MRRIVVALIALYVVSGFSRTVTPFSRTVMLHAQQAAPPAPAPVFRSGTRLIVENVSVKDKSGTPVEGLTAKDFTITEDGEPQAITFVEFQRLAAPKARPTAPVVPAPVALSVLHRCAAHLLDA